MSQAKVDRYKEEKKNRAKIMAKQKRDAMITKVCGGVIAAVLVVWAGFSVYDTLRTKPAEDPVTAQNYTVDTGSLDAYLNSLSAD
jgi:hypothetical protein